MQNYGNHRRFHPAFHFVGFPIALFSLVVTAANAFGAWTALAPWAALGVAFTAFLGFFLARGYAIKAQDRAIVAQEGLRHLVLTGKPLPSGLSWGQVIALRFSADAEFPELAARAAKENLSADDVKKAVKDWRADENRV